jgi:uncharacterized protein
VKHTITLLFVFMLIAVANGQTRIQYFDDNWQPSTPENASYYRTLPSKTDDGYVIEDYFMSGQLQMKAISTSADSDIFHGNVIWYNPNGTIKQTAHYNNGILNGELISYNNSGTELARATYVNNDPTNGSVYTEEPHFYAITEYDNGKPMRHSLFDNSANPTKAKIVSSLLLDKETIQTDYYDQFGKFIGSLTGNSLDDDYSHGKVVEYYANPITVNSIAERQNGVWTSPRKHLYTNGNVKFIEYFGAPNQDNEQWVVGCVFFDNNGNKLDSLGYNSDLPYEGKSYTFYSDFNNSQQTDTIQRIDTYSNGALNGTSQAFYPNGKLLWTAQFENHSPTGTKTTYDQSGNEIFYVDYKDGAPWNGREVDGLIETEYRNGQPIEERTYYDFSSKKIKHINKNFEGYASETSTYDINGKLLGTLSYNNNYERNGLMVDIDEEGHPSEITEYLNDNAVSSQHFVNGTLICHIVNDGISFYQNPKTKEKFHCSFVDGEPFEGTVLEYEYDYSDVLAVKNHKEGKLHGTSTHYVYDFELDKSLVSIVENYENGMLHGTKTQYNGQQKLYEQTYENNELHGLAIYYDQDGAELSQVVYENGQPQNGTVYEYDYYNNIASSIPYVNGVRQGDASFFDDGELTSIETYDDDQLVETLTVFPFQNDTHLIMTYSDGIPSNGSIYEFGVLRSFENGLLKKQTTYDTETGLPLQDKVYGNDNHFTETKYHANGNVFYTLNGIDETPHGTITYFMSNGKEYGKGIFDNGTPVSGTFIAPNYYFDENDDYIVIKLTKSMLVASMVEQGKKTETLKKTFAGNTPSSSQITAFVGLLQNSYPSFEFGLLYGYSD